ncbi:MAG: YfcC family protein [Acutalibacteraceae bacterium]
MENEKTAQPEAAVQPKKKGTGIQIDKKTVFGITALLIVIMLFAGVLTQIVPRGEYQMDESGMVINGTYTQFEGDEGKMPWWKIILAPIMVFTSSQITTGVGIVVFIVLIGGTFLILDRSGVLKYIMSSVVKKFEKKKYLLLAAIVFVCMMMSSVVGVLEESLTLVPLAVAIALALGWDSFVGLGISLVSIAFGYTAATFNPFNVGILQTMADLPLFSGLLYRILIFICVYISLVLFLTVYAKKIEKHPEKSLCYESDKELRVRFGAEIDNDALNNPALKKATKTFVGCVGGVLLIVALSFVLQKVDSISDSTKELLNYLPLVGMAVLFTVGGLSAGYIAGIRGKALGGGFWEGVKTIAPCLPMIWAILSITYVLQEGNIIHTILYYVYQKTASMSKVEALFAIFLFVVALEFIVGSGTAKAFLIMPIVMPLADLLGLTRQSIVLAFTMGDGFCNILYPTSGIMIIAIGMVGISYGKYLRWSWKLFVIEFAIAALAMLGAVAIGY